MSPSKRKGKKMPLFYRYSRLLSILKLIPFQSSLVLCYVLFLFTVFDFLLRCCSFSNKNFLLLAVKNAQYDSCLFRCCPTQKSCYFKKSWSLHMAFFKELYIPLKNVFSFLTFLNQNRQNLSSFLYFTPHGNKKTRRISTYIQTMLMK